MSLNIFVTINKRQDWDLFSTILLHRILGTKGTKVQIHTKYEFIVRIIKDVKTGI